MKNTMIYFILGLMSLLIGSHFLAQDSGYNPMNLTRELAPGHLLFALGVILIVYCFGVFFIQLLSLRQKNDTNHLKNSKDEAPNQ